MQRAPLRHGRRDIVDRTRKPRRWASTAAEYSAMLSEFLTRKIGNLRFRLFALCVLAANPTYVRRIDRVLVENRQELPDSYQRPAPRVLRVTYSWVRVLRLA